MLSIAFEQDFQKIANINSQSFPVEKTSSRKTQKVTNPQN